MKSLVILLSFISSVSLAGEKVELIVGNPCPLYQEDSEKMAECLFLEVKSSPLGMIVSAFVYVGKKVIYLVKGSNEGTVEIRQITEEEGDEALTRYPAAVYEKEASKITPGQMFGRVLLQYQ